MLYYELIHSKYFKTKIYRHHWFSLIFILVSCSILKTIYIILSLSEGTDNYIFFESRKWLIPVSIIVFFIYRVSRVFIICNEKYYLEKKTIPLMNYLLLYGIYGLIITGIGALLSSLIPCGDDNLPELSKKVCDYVDNNQNYYFDSYKIFFNTLYSEYFASKLILLFVKSILIFGSTYYIYAIYQKLSPIYYICMHRLDALIVTVLAFINQLINNKIEGINITIKIVDILISFFYILGSIVYLEFIELNFCKLYFYTKRSIQERSRIDSMISLDDLSSKDE